MTKSTLTGQYCDDLSCLCNEARGFRVALQVAVDRYQTNKAKRFHMYKFTAQRLGYKTRTKLPDCVEQLIKDTFPDDDGHYTGFIPAA